MPAKHSVAILGGGVGGLSAAHELAERGFAVTVYERNAAFGGKARSLSVAGSGTGGRKDLPGEHGFRFFPGFYKHITDTMRRIPFGTRGANCRDNLVQATRILLARQARSIRSGSRDFRKPWTISGPRFWHCSTISTFRITRSRSSSRDCWRWRRVARSATTRSSSRSRSGISSGRTRGPRTIADISGRG